MILLVMGDSTDNTTTTSIVQRRINTLTGKPSSSNDFSKTTPPTIGVKPRSGLRSTTGISNEKRVPKKPVPVPRSGLKPPATMKVAVTSSTASKFATSRMTASQIRYASKRTVEVTSTAKTSSNFTATKRTVVKPAPPIAIRTSTVNLTKTKKESSIPQVSKRQPKLTKDNKEKNKENKPATTNENVKECKCDRNQNCICKDHDRPQKGGSTSLKKTKSTRTPQRHATYVSELNKDIRRKFQKQKAEREREGDNKEKPKVKPKPTKKVEQTNERNLQNSVGGTGRVVVHCPLHSKFGNQLSSRFIKARCIPECPHYHDAKRSRSNSPASTISNVSPMSSPAVQKRITGAARGNSGKAIPKVTKPVPYIITASKKAATVRNGTSSNVRVRSAPTVSKTPVKKPVQSYLVRNGIIPDPVKASMAVPRTTKKVRQKSFRLSRTKSKSFKYKNKPSVVKKAQQINKELQKVSALESDDNVSTTDFETDGLSADCLSTSDGGHSSSEEAINQQRTVPKTKKPLRQKSLRLSRSKSRSKSFRTKKKVTKRCNSKKSIDSMLSEDSLHFDEDSLGDQGVGSFVDLNLDDLELVKGVFLDGEGSGDDEDLEFETDDELVTYYFEVFKREFPEIVEQAHLTKEEMVNSHAVVHFFPLQQLTTARKI